jgi:NADH dehydrogenase
MQSASLEGSLTGCDAVMNLAGIISEAGENTFKNVHVLGTRNLLAAAKAAGIKRFIQMSAMGTRANAVARYHQTKWLAEESVRASGLDFTILRPSIIYGRHDHFVNLFAGMAKFSPLLPVMGDGCGKLQPISVEDVARCFVGALNEPRSIGHTYELGGNERMEFNEILDTILRVTHRKRLKLHVPMPVAKIQASVMEFILSKLLGKASPLTRDQLLMLQEDNVADASAAISLFGLKPETFENGIAGYLT